MKKLIALLAAVFLLLHGCGVQKATDTGYTKYSAEFYGCLLYTSYRDDGIDRARLN